MAKQKRKMNKRESEKFMPGVSRFNKLAKQFIDLLGGKIEEKERKINVMVSRIAQPKSKDHMINIRTASFSSSLFNKKKKKKSGSSSWNEDFSQKRGWMI
ncbi:hypothetical protein DID77_00085 [Candidatus Marinamargulisbacteria bacterium SCGC AG-439-L15]|nr:hypothetical protein DID77_00085 [Candidatus Marinamargulisbacteria bacterium SCGC AG-439-L15]